MDKGTVFTSSIDGTSYQFVTNQSYTIQPDSGVFQFAGVQAYEGTLVTFKYTKDTSDPDQKFIIPSNNADTSTLKVTVQNSSSDSTQEVYSLVTGYSDLTGTSKVYFLQEVEDGKFEVYFGGENLTNVQQNNPILGSDNPFGLNFDTTIVYAPIFGRAIYTGLRFKIN